MPAQLVALASPVYAGCGVLPYLGFLEMVD